MGMKSNAKVRLQMPSNLEYLRTTVFLFILGLAIIVLGLIPELPSLWQITLHAVGGAVISLGLVETLHEYTVAKKVRAEFMVLADFIEKGIERVCTSEEIQIESPALLAKTKSLKVLGIGISWLVTGDNKTRIEEMLARNQKIMILIPDPLSSEIRERYEKDEPPSFELGLEGLARRVCDWYDLKKRLS